MNATPLHPEFLDKVTQTALARGRTWDAIADVLEEPGVALVTRLRSGDLVATLTASAAWLGEDTHMLTAELMSLEVYARSSSRRPLAGDLEEFRADHAAYVVARSTLISPIRELAALCRQESGAWEAGDLEAGKTLRAGQRDFLDAHLVPELPELASALATSAAANVWRLLGRVILATLSAETGRDYQRAVLGEGLGRRRNPR